MKISYPEPEPEREESTIITFLEAPECLKINLIVGNRIKLSRLILSYCYLNNLGCSVFSQPLIVMTKEETSSKEILNYLKENNIKIQSSDGDCWSLI